MEKLREQYGPHITADMTILGLRREVKRLGELLTKVLSLEQEADARASATEAALQRERSKLTRAEAKLREAEYALEQKDLELADKTDQLAELSQLRCLPSESANSLASEVVSLRRQLALVKEQNENLNDQVANTRRQLVLARLKVTS
jgi:chromosome segregation ATPase